MVTAFTIIDGSNANIDITIATASIKCQATYWSADFARDFTEKTTFCTSGWRSRQPGLKQLLGVVDGLLAKGADMSGSTAISPASFIASTSAQAYVLTADTGCTFTFNGHAGRVHSGIRAALNSEFALNFESDGAVTTAWVVA